MFFAGCGGGGSGGGGGPTFTLLSIAPDVSNDLNGGDVVVITGTNFNAIQVTRVLFDNQPGFSASRTSNTTIQVTTPPAPAGVAQTVNVTVETLNAGSRFLSGAFTYVGSSTPPAPQTITPTVFTPTGAESFSIQGTNLGPPGGTVQVAFAGVGTVTGNVSLNAQFVTGRAPLSPVPPPGAPLTVTVTSGTQSGDVPTQVTFGWAPPSAVPMNGQAAGNASQPVRLADGYAVLCCAGPDNFWTSANADDEIVIIQGPPNALRVTRLAVGFLSPTNSIPAVLNADTLCVYWIGPDRAVATADDGVVLITQARTATPAISIHNIPYLNSAPVASIAPNAIAYTHAGPDTVRASGDDVFEAMTFNGVLSTRVALGTMGYVDVTGPGSVTIPFSADGDSVFCLGIGPDATRLTGDDRLFRSRISSPGGTVAANAAFLAGPPVALSATLAVGAAGQAQPAGVGADVLAVFQVNGPALNLTTHQLNTSVNVGALVPMARLGADNVAVLLAGVNLTPGDNDDQMRVFTDPVNNTSSSLLVPGTALIAPLGSGDIVFFGTGADLAHNTLDDRVTHLEAGAVSVRNFLQVQRWNRAIRALTDNDRAFSVGAGPDALPGTGDETLLVHQTLAIGTATDSLALPLAALSSPATGAQPFVPVGPNWGLVQSPGPDGVYGNVDDVVVLAQY